jgi:thiol-disulfide isomerase/thioredoxin
MRVVRALAVAALLAVSVVAATVPRQAPEFAVQMPGNSQILLSHYRGKVVVIEFLFTTCPHCQHASQIMSKLQTEYGARGFQALGVAFNEMGLMLVPDFVRDFKVNYPVGYSPRDPVVNFLQAKSNESIHVPQLVFVDRKGVIRHQSLQQGDSVTHTEANMRKLIEQLLGEPAPVSAKKTKKKAS